MTQDSSLAVGPKIEAAPPAPARARRTPAWLRLSRDPSALVGFLIVAIILLAALAAPLLAPHEPGAQNLRARLQPPAFLEGGSPQFPLGTDQLGRDLLSRLIHGARVSLLVGLASVALAGTVGVLIGLLAGYFGGMVDRVLSRLIDIQLAFPFILLAMTVVAALGPSLRNLILTLGFAGWVVYARVVRSQVLSVKQNEFVEAARAIGATHARILGYHILPNVTSSAIVVASFSVAQMVILESVLSYLGLGVQAPFISWGGMLADSRSYMNVAWWTATVPGLAIMFTVLGINLVGDWLRDWIDPRLRVD